MASSEIPEWAKSPSALETVLYYHGLGVALQARTVDPVRKQPEDCDIPYHEDLLAAWPAEDHDDLIELDHIKLGIIQNAKQAYLVDISDTRPQHWFLHGYQQKYLAFSEPEDTALIQKWNEVTQSQDEGLIQDLLAVASDYPAAQMVLLLARIQMNTLRYVPKNFKKAPTKTVLLIDMSAKDWLPKAQSLELAYRCKAVLVRHNILNVEVEVRALPSILWTSADSESGATSGNESPAAIERNEAELATRLENEQRRERLVGLTCNYVVQRTVNQQRWPPLSEPYLRQCDQDIETGHAMTFFSSKRTKDLRIDRETGVATVINKIRRSLNGREERNEWEWKGAPLERHTYHTDVQNKIEAQRIALKKLEAFCEAIPENGPRLGTVHAAGAYGTMSHSSSNALSTQFLSDWALINFDPGYLTSHPECESQLHAKPWLAWQNRLHLDCDGRFQLRMRQRNDSSEDSTEYNSSDFGYRENSKLHELTEHRSFMFYKISGPSRLFQLHKPVCVYKHGASTGFTSGETIGPLAVVSQPRAGVESREVSWATELVVTPLDPDTPFSKDGDTGSAVLNRKRKVIGLLTKGAYSAWLVNEGEDAKERLRQEEAAKLEQRFNDVLQHPMSERSGRWLRGNMCWSKSHDLTFVTPIEPILEDIYEVTGQHAEIA